MDNKRTGFPYWDTIDDKEFYGEYYNRFLQHKKHVFYMFENFVIERPSMKDFKHIYMCALLDEGYTEDDLLDESLWPEIRHVRDMTRWIFDHSKVDEEVYVGYMDGEYVGYGTVLINNTPVPGSTEEEQVIELGSLAVGTEVYIRPKFRQGKAVVCVYDFFTNMLGQGKTLMTDNADLSKLFDEKNYKKNYQKPQDLIDYSPYLYRERVHKILTKRMQRGKYVK